MMTGERRVHYGDRGRDQPWTKAQYDRRQTCWCEHRFGDHASGGTRCLAASDETPGGFCQCHRWEPLRPRLNRGTR